MKIVPKKQLSNIFPSESLSFFQRNESKYYSIVLHVSILLASLWTYTMDLPKVYEKMISVDIVSIPESYEYGSENLTDDSSEASSDNQPEMQNLGEVYKVSKSSTPKFSEVSAKSRQGFKADDADKKIVKYEQVISNAVKHHIVKIIGKKRKYRKRIQISVEIDHYGKVLSAYLIQETGISWLDQKLERALTRISKLPKEPDDYSSLQDHNYIIPLDI